MWVWLIQQDWHQISCKFGEAILTPGKIYIKPSLSISILPREANLHVLEKLESAILSELLLGNVLERNS